MNAPSTRKQSCGWACVSWVCSHDGNLRTFCLHFSVWEITKQRKKEDEQMTVFSIALKGMRYGEVSRQLKTFTKQPNKKLGHLKMILQLCATQVWNNQSTNKLCKKTRLCLLTKYIKMTSSSMDQSTLLYILMFLHVSKTSCQMALLLRVKSRQTLKWSKF